jgi:hypothetical protein
MLGIIVGGLGLYAYQRANRPAPVERVALESARQEGEVTHEIERATSNFKCDGRTHCSQMTSCDEAIYFLQNCPGVKMDGEGDGVPCERQWCGDR